jgi:hypothetical protein
MLEQSRAELGQRLAADAVVLDVGGWADPLERADWVIDLFAYESRGLYARRGWIAPRADAGPERFTERTWIQRDVCDREPFPFADDEIDFVVCSQTLEDVRDPVFVCAEIQRVGRAGYIEVPSRLEEQSFGVAGEYVGWPHHHWLVDVGEGSIEFVFKSHAIHSDPAYRFPLSFWQGLAPAERVQSLWWEGGFGASERVIFEEGAERIAYLADFVERELRARGLDPAPAAAAPLARARRRAARALRGRR